MTETALPDTISTATRLSRRAFTIAVTGIGLVSAIVGLAFALWPDLQPERSPSRQSAFLNRLTVERGTSFGEYLARIDQPSSSYSRHQLTRRGALLNFRVAITGFKGKHLKLKWELFEDANGKQVSESKAIVITPTNRTNVANWQFWIPLPKRRGPFFAVVELLEKKEHYNLKLDSRETKRFTGLS